MKPFFHDPARIRLLDTEAARWEGTPFFKNSASPGRGADCVRYAHALLHAAGALPPVAVPHYARDHGRPAPRSPRLRFILAEDALAVRLTFTPPAMPRLPGDLYALRAGMTDHHLAVHLSGDRLTHALEHHGVVIHPADDPRFQSRILYILRPVEKTEGLKG
jgi:hypothetical protein